MIRVPRQGYWGTVITVSKREGEKAPHGSGGGKGLAGTSTGKEGEQAGPEFFLRIGGILSFTPSPKYWSLGPDNGERYQLQRPECLPYPKAFTFLKVGT